MKITGKRKIGLFCRECKGHTIKELKYIRQRMKQGKSEFYCERKCANKAHSKKMQGENNPNYNGIFRGITMRERTPEEREEIGKKISETMIKRGTSVGSNNPRWVGGEIEYECVMCGKETYKRPHVSRKIERGEMSPCCSHECSTALARRNIVFEDTSIELAVAEELTERGIEYVGQFNLADKFRPDFLIPEFNIIIECDGDYWHNLPEVIARDKRKNAYYEACGYTVFRFWEHEIIADVEACVDIVLAEINAITA